MAGEKELNMTDLMQLHDQQEMKITYTPDTGVYVWKSLMQREHVLGGLALLIRDLADTKEDAELFIDALDEEVANGYQ